MNLGDVPAGLTASMKSAGPVCRYKLPANRVVDCCATASHASATVKAALARRKVRRLVFSVTAGKLRIGGVVRPYHACAFPGPAVVGAVKHADSLRLDLIHYDLMMSRLNC